MTVVCTPGWMRSMSPRSAPLSVVDRPGNWMRAPASTSIVTSTSLRTAIPSRPSRRTETSVPVRPSAGRLSPATFTVILSTGELSRSRKELKGRGPMLSCPPLSNRLRASGKSALVVLGAGWACTAPTPCSRASTATAAGARRAITRSRALDARGLFIVISHPQPAAAPSSQAPPLHPAPCAPSPAPAPPRCTTPQ